MRNTANIVGPVVVGGIGGSGTRVLAEILRTLNFYIGNDLNVPLDNLTYTLLFKRPRWFYQNKGNKKKLFKGLRIMEKSMLRSGGLTISEYLYLVQAVISMSRFGHNIHRDGSGTWPLMRVKKMFEPLKGNHEGYIGWGWKEPNSHLLMNEMNNYFENVKIIHLIRHGLDMAFNQNQQQLFNWGPMFGVDLPQNHLEIPQASFKYWVRANRLALENGRMLGPQRFLWVNYDQFCIDPEPGLKKILKFLNVQVEEMVFRKCLALPKIAASSGIFRNKSIAGFLEEDLSFLRSLGFEY